MATQKPRIKVDNRSLTSKVTIRKWLIDQLGLTDVRVLDLCTGTGAVWSEMEKHCSISRWTKIDKNVRAPGTLKMDATLAAKSLPLTEYNIIDIDPYGDPWDIYLAVLPRITQRIGVVVTNGHVRENFATHATLGRLGIPSSWDTPENPLPHIPAQFIADRILEQTWKYVNILHAAAIHFQSRGPSGVSYYALALEPIPLVPPPPTRQIHLEGVAP